MPHITISNDTVRFQVLQEVLSQLTSGELASTLSAEAKRELRRITHEHPVYNLMALAKVCDLRVEVRLEDLRGSMDKVLLMKEDEEGLDYFIRNGASADVCCELFKLHHADYMRRRQMIGAASAAQGRPRLPPEKQRDRIVEDWCRLLPMSTPTVVQTRQALRALHHQHSTWSIQALWTVVRCDATPTPAACGIGMSRSAKAERFAPA